MKGSGTIVLVVPCGDHHNEIEFGNDANLLPASAKRLSPVKHAPVDQGTTKPPKVSIRSTVLDLDPRGCRDLDPCLGHDLAAVPAAARKN